MISIAFLSLAGVPPLAGFFSKLIAFQILFHGGNYFIGFLVIFISIFAMIYYLRVVRFLIVRMTDQAALFDKTSNKLHIDIPKSASILITVCSFINILIVLFFPFLFCFIFLLGCDMHYGMCVPYMLSEYVHFV